MGLVIRSFNWPVLFNCRTLEVYVVTSLSPVTWRKFLWNVRKHRDAARLSGSEVVLPGHAVPAIPEFTKIAK